jgi:drug/metabolite transporter (DMT)-like permease
MIFTRWPANISFRVFLFYAGLSIFSFFTLKMLSKVKNEWMSHVIYILILSLMIFCTPFLFEKTNATPKNVAWPLLCWANFIGYSYFNVYKGAIIRNKE